MSLSNEELKSTFENHDDDQIRLLTNAINDNSTSISERKNYCQQHILINYRREKWQAVLDDIEIIEETGDLCDSLLVLKLKASIHEQCRMARLRLMERISDGVSSQDLDLFFLNIREEKVNEFMNGQSSTNLHSPPAKQKKRQKASN